MLRLPCVTQTLYATIIKKCLCSMPIQQNQRFLSTASIVHNSINNNSIPKSEVTKCTEWRTIYRLPLIRMASAFSRLKIYQAAITIAGTPIAYGLVEAGHISLPATYIFCAVGVSGFITLTIVSYVLKNLVGFIYINEAQNLLKLAYVDFWGQRRQAIIKIDDLILPWEQDDTSHNSILSRFNCFQSIKMQNDTKTQYKLLQRFGVITEPDTFVGLFGE